MSPSIAIPLTQGKTVYIDATDFEKVSAYSWRAERKDRRNGTEIWYAATTIGSRKTSRHTLYMHTLILGKRDGYVTDHIDHDGLNNRRENLRHATHSQNAINTRLRSDNKSGHRGVFWDSRRGAWQVKIWLNGKQIFGGYFADPVLATVARDALAREIHGQFSVTEFDE